MNRLTFIQEAGGVYTHHQGWSWLTSRDKRLRFWQFYRQHHPKSRTVYGQLPIQKILHDNSYSIEHIIPHSELKRQLHGKIENGASINPFNLIPAHQEINKARGSSAFDFDNDPLESTLPLLSKRRKKSHQSGFDADGEWIVPPRSRGEIARSILYMLLCYPLNDLYADHHQSLINWAQKDIPSKIEQDYNAWVEQKWKIRNPLIESPDILDRPSFLYALQEAFPPC